MQCRDEFKRQAYQRVSTEDAIVVAASANVTPAEVHTGPTADAWSRTGRAASRPVKLRSGLVLMAQPGAEGTLHLPLAPALNPVQQLDRTLCEIAERYGASRRDRVMQELEYPAAATGGAQ